MKLADHKFLFYLAAIAVLSWLLVKLTGVIEISRMEAPLHSPDYFSTGYTKWEMSDQGTLKSKVLADEMMHYSDDGITHLKNLAMYFYSDNAAPWVVRSETGELSADGKDLFLNGQVAINRAGDADTRELIINTSNLKVKPETSHAETSEWAELISPPNRTVGTGMKLVFVEPIYVELLSHVKGRYEKK
ncbi:MAG: LPS export ABC transporter periplasmic protein LptC [Methylococcaceae bacterium]|nr:LPS export ABC transporter periplasmic protein LptC [Methylococcaceae bacterium]MDZ4155983.1 LPS export ABC transporter periplasmic protein LptC [Methylococcales bacterium]MDP2395198.1 LPS export ABC transporter periplasmic protein LptC [Methylococcaceae bacterium]MDP3018660.1 LPS export ABC transporter periplasmic protein LptC [Methylococcaceae bacterium]MDP3388854.1 LPS export ABC transporter periplasmic protein LptC [Methylococcaceae bacterium]